MNKMKTLVLAIGMFAFHLPGFGQSVEMADKFRGEGKIYVVVTVVLLLLISIFFYLFRIDKKLSNFEQDQNSEQ